MKVFFSRITLEDKLGMQHEPYIYAALNSAKVMLAFGTKFEDYDAVLVKNDWSRFLDMMKNDHTKALIPCFKDMDTCDMPKEFNALHTQDMGKPDWMQDLVRDVEKLCGKNTDMAQPAQQTVVREMVQQKNSNADNLMEWVNLFLEDGDFNSATEYIAKVLDEDAKYAPAYVAKVLVQFKMKKESQLATLSNPLDSNPYWMKALQFANSEQRKKYLNYVNAISANQKYSTAVIEMTQRDYPSAIVSFNQLGDYKDSKARLKECIDAYRKIFVRAQETKESPQMRTAKEKIEHAEQETNKMQLRAKRIV